MICKKCNIEKSISEFSKHRKYKSGFRTTCRECSSKYYKAYRDSNIEICRMKEKERKAKGASLQERIARGLRTRLNTALKGKRKSNKTLTLLGCTIQEFIVYMESKFTEGMTWENRGLYGWHIDHIMPCDSFDMSKPEDQKKCFHYTNMQPLWATDNLKKSNKIL